MTRAWCPGCQPDVDPLRELVTEVRCAGHTPMLEGAADDQVRMALRDAPAGGGGDESGDRNAAMCAAVHRGEGL